MKRGNSRNGSSVSGSGSQKRPGPPRSLFAQNPAEIYNDLLEEALRQSRSASSSPRPLKKRRSQRDPNVTEAIVVDDPSSGRESANKGQQREVYVIDSTEEESADDDNMEWDEVDLTARPASTENLQPEYEETSAREVTLQANPKPKDSEREKRAVTTARTAASRQIRLEGHKLHLLALLASFRHLNSLLSSPSLLKIVRPFVPPATINALNTGPELPQSSRTVAFLRGLKDIMKTWHDKWRETKQGWRRPRWVAPTDLGKVR
jgi:xeroderma pigmentosum group C-complementing protein